MPRFWGLANNSHDFRYRFASGDKPGEKGGYHDEVNGAAWADAEIDAVVAWIVSESTRRARTWPAADLTKGDPKRGAQIFIGDNEKSEGQAKACVACHDVTMPAAYKDLAVDRAKMKAFPGGWNARMSRRQGPDLTGIGSKVDGDWLVYWLKDPRGYWHDTNMPDLRLTDQEALDVAAFLMGLKHESFDKLAGVTVDEKITKLMAQELKVSEQAESTIAAVGIVEKWSPEQRKLYVGEKLVKHYGCFGCHTIDKFKDATPIGTELTEWGSKLIARLEFNHAPIEHTRFDFAYTKMVNPRIYDHGVARSDRPLERLKMPRFGFTPDEARDIAMFLVGLVNDPVPAPSLFNPDGRQRDIIRGRQVIRRYNCQGCHVIEGEGGDVWPAIEKVNWRPPDLLGQGRKTNPPWLFKFMKAPDFVLEYSPEGQDRVRPWHTIRMPTFNLSDEEARAVVRYFAALSRVTPDFESEQPDTLLGKGEGYPKTFEVKDPNDATGERKVKREAKDPLGEADTLFEVYACKSCHSEDPNIPIENRAPNFRHTMNGRLRGPWIETWLWGPYKLQQGTKMPTFFGRKEPKPQSVGEDYFKADTPGDQAERQIWALRDYILYHYKDE
jgi:cytochrome c2